jgi:hypothetical protein
MPFSKEAIKNPGQISFFGTGILVKNSKNVTIKNLRASRYKSSTESN